MMHVFNKHLLTCHEAVHEAVLAKTEIIEGVWKIYRRQ